MSSIKQRRILIVGATSKIASHFVDAYPNTHELYGTYNGSPQQAIPDNRQFQLDLGDNDQIRAFIKRVSAYSFDAVLFFAATYSPDPDNAEDYITAYQKDIQLNAISTVLVARGLQFADNSKVFLFGDAGLGHPKKGHTSYSISKFAVADITRLLAVELAPRTATFCFKLGPTLKATSKQSESYYDRNLLKVSDPVKGLVNLLHFLITEDSFNATGCIIDYDGGAYLKRPIY